MSELNNHPQMFSVLLSYLPLAVTRIRTVKKPSRDLSSSERKQIHVGQALGLGSGGICLVWSGAWCSPWNSPWRRGYGYENKQTNMHPVWNLEISEST